MQRDDARLRGGTAVAEPLAIDMAGIRGDVAGHVVDAPDRAVVLVGDEDVAVNVGHGVDRIVEQRLRGKATVTGVADLRTAGNRGDELRAGVDLANARPREIAVR